MDSYMFEPETEDIELTLGSIIKYYDFNNEEKEGYIMDIVILSDDEAIITVERLDYIPIVEKISVDDIIDF